MGDLGEEGKKQEGEEKEGERSRRRCRTSGGENPSVATIYNFVQLKGAGVCAVTKPFRCAACV